MEPNTQVVVLTLGLCLVTFWIVLVLTWKAFRNELKKASWPGRIMIISGLLYLSEGVTRDLFHLFHWIPK